MVVSRLATAPKTLPGCAVPGATRSNPTTVDCEAVGRHRLRRPGNGAGAAGALWLATREVAQVRAIELPGVQLLDRRVGIGERPLRDAQEVECPVEVPSFRRAADEN